MAAAAARTGGKYETYYMSGSAWKFAGTGMKSITTSIFLFLFIVGAIINAGCLHRPDDTHRACCCINQSAAAIGIALTDPDVGLYLKEPYSIAEVNSNATTTISANGKTITMKTYDVMIDTPGSIVHVHVDVKNCTVANIWPQYKRFIPAPTETI